MLRKAIVLLLCLASPAVMGAELTCKKSPALTGSCSTVKGSLGLTPGIGVTVNSEEGGRIIIKAPPDSNADIAPPVMQNWLYWQSKTGSMKTRITGTLRPAASLIPVRPWCPRRHRPQATDRS